MKHHSEKRDQVKEPCPTSAKRSLSRFCSNDVTFDTSAQRPLANGKVDPILSARREYKQVTWQYPDFLLGFPECGHYQIEIDFSKDGMLIWI